MIEALKHIPAWFILLILLVILLVLWEFRPDSTVEQLVTGVSGALLLSLRPSQPQPPTP